MGQGNIKRLQFIPRVTVLNPKNDDIQDVDFTGYFEINDKVDVIDVDSEGNVIGVLANNLSVLAIDPETSLTLSAAVDTTAATGTPKIRCQEIDDGQDAIDRLYRRRLSGKLEMTLRQNILAQQLNKPSAGQTTFEVEDASLWRAGDTVDVLADEGIVDDDSTIVSVSPNADDSNNRATIVVDEVIDALASTNPFILNTALTVDKAIVRNQERIDELDRPVENEDGNVINGESEGTLTAFETEFLFRQYSSKVYIDGTKKKLGTAGTRATLSQGSGDSQLICDSMLMGLLGNEVEIEVVDAAGLAVSVTKTFKANSTEIISAQTQYLVQVNSNSGSATAKEICDAINADSVAKRIVQMKFGGDGSGVVTPFGPTSLAGGLDDGTGDYAEIEQVRYVNDGTSLVNANTGYKWISFHIRPDERNRMNEPLEQDEEIELAYRRPMENVNR